MKKILQEVPGVNTQAPIINNTDNTQEPSTNTQTEQPSTTPEAPVTTEPVPEAPIPVTPEVPTSSPAVQGVNTVVAQDINNQESIVNNANNTQEPITNDQTVQHTPSIPSQEGSTTITTYSSDHPSIIFKDDIQFTQLESILEVSSINTRQRKKVSQTLTQQIKDYKPITNEELRTRSLPTNSISYQLSPNKEDWYYYGGEEKWEKTTQGYSSSNTIQEVNQYLGFYPIQVGTNDLYIKAYLNSDGNTQVELNKIIVNRELEIVTELNQQEAGSLEAKKEEVVLSPIKLSNIIPSHR